MALLIPFEPAVWARDSHSQTILGDLLPSAKINHSGKKMVVELEDGDRLVCRLHEGSSPFIFILSHGLTGSSDAGYIHRITRIMNQQGHTVCRMNHRNCGEGFGHSRQSNHAGRSDDIARVIYDLKKDFPRKNVCVIGFSLSGNASLLLASGVVPGQNIFNRDAFLERATHSRWSLPDLVISVNPPIEFMRTTERFLQNFNRLYQWNFVRVFHKLVKDLKKMELLEQPYKTHPFMSIRQFDDIYTAQRGGFGTAANYYNLCGAAPYLKQVFVPSFVLTTKDDPIVDFKDIEKAEKSEFVTTRLENQGGHMGYLCKGKTPLGDYRWMDYAIDGIFKKMIA